MYRGTPSASKRYVVTQAASADPSRRRPSTATAQTRIQTTEKAATPAPLAARRAWEEVGSERPAARNERQSLSKNQGGASHKPPTVKPVVAELPARRPSTATAKAPSASKVLTQKASVAAGANDDTAAPVERREAWGADVKLPLPDVAKSNQRTPSWVRSLVRDAVRQSANPDFLTRSDVTSSVASPAKVVATTSSSGEHAVRDTGIHEPSKMPGSVPAPQVLKTVAAPPSKALSGSSEVKTPSPAKAKPAAPAPAEAKVAPKRAIPTSSESPGKRPPKPSLGLTAKKSHKRVASIIYFPDASEAQQKLIDAYLSGKRDAVSAVKKHNPGVELTLEQAKRLLKRVTHTLLCDIVNVISSKPQQHKLEFMREEAEELKKVALIAAVPPLPAPPPPLRFFDNPWEYIKRLINKSTPVEQHPKPVITTLTVSNPVKNVINLNKDFGANLNYLNNYRNEVFQAIDLDQLTRACVFMIRTATKDNIRQQTKALFELLHSKGVLLDVLDIEFDGSNLRNELLRKWTNEVSIVKAYLGVLENRQHLNARIAMFKGAIAKFSAETALASAKEIIDFLANYKQLDLLERLPSGGGGCSILASLRNAVGKVNATALIAYLKLKQRDVQAAQPKKQACLDVKDVELNTVAATLPGATALSTTSADTSSGSGADSKSNSSDFSGASAAATPPAPQRTLVAAATPKHVPPPLAGSAYRVSDPHLRTTVALRAVMDHKTGAVRARDFRSHSVFTHNANPSQSHAAGGLAPLKPRSEALKALAKIGFLDANKPGPARKYSVTNLLADAESIYDSSSAKRSGKGW